MADSFGSSSDLVSESPPESFDRDRHVCFLQMMYQLLPSQYQGQEINRLTLAYFAISGLDIHGALDCQSSILQSRLKSIREEDEQIWRNIRSVFGVKLHIYNREDRDCHPYEATYLLVPGKSAQECFDKVHSDHLTPPQHQPRTRARTNTSSPLSFSLSASDLLKSPVLNVKNKRKSHLPHKTVRHLLHKSYQVDSNYDADLFSVLESTSNPPPVLSTPEPKPASLLIMAHKLFHFLNLQWQNPPFQIRSSSSIHHPNAHKLFHFLNLQWQNPPLEMKSPSTFLEKTKKMNSKWKMMNSNLTGNWTENWTEGASEDF